MKKAVYPGSFDPITSGHLSILKRGLKIFDQITILIMKNVNKKGFFSLDERKKLIKIATKDLENVKVDVSTNLLVNYLKENHIQIILKGLRGINDFSIEQEMAFINNHLDNQVETIFLTSFPEELKISSSTVRELITYQANLDGFVPKEVSEQIYKFLEDRK